ncbi:hypothetical protein ACFT1A_01990 [Rhodococcus sp. NPDC057135]|uniref:hypothetical protein n=1 Tax=Rhodococcus sp. NPDC057135 TaxID=3346028 RepID=UPI00363C0980
MRIESCIDPDAHGLPKYESHWKRGLAMPDLSLLSDDELRERRIALSQSLTTAADLIPTPSPSFFEKLKQDIDAAAAEWIARHS